MRKLLLNPTPLYRKLRQLSLLLTLLLMPIGAWGQTSYGLTINDVQVTSENAENVLGNGTVSFSQVNNGSGIVNTL